MSDVTSDRRVRQAEGVVYRNLRGAAVVVNLSTGACFELDEIGTQIWELIGPGSSERAILEILLDRYDGERAMIESELVRLLDELATHRLIHTADEGRGRF